MRFYSLTDDFSESGTGLVDLSSHDPTTQLGAAWVDLPPTPIAQIDAVLDAVVFRSGTTAAIAQFDAHAADGFADQFQIRLTVQFSDDPLSAGQLQRFVIADASDQGYVIQLMTDLLDNDQFTYEIQQWNEGVLTPIVGLTATVTRSDLLFNVFAEMQDGQLSIRLNSEAALTATAPANHDFASIRLDGSDPSDTDKCFLKRLFLLGDLIDPVFAEEYTDLLIKQYHEKPKAFAEIKLQAETWSKVYSFMTEIPEEFDVDAAFGEQLDIISKTVFGFVARDVTGVTLTDEELRTCIKAKIASNWSSAYLVSDDRISIQEVVQQVFNGGAYVVDNQDMALTLYIDPSVSIDLWQKVFELDLLPTPQGVRYRAVVQYTEDSFGFPLNPNAKTWDDKFTPATDPGTFAEKVIF